MSVRKSSHGTIFLIVSSGSPRALIASSLRSTSKKPFCPMTRSLHPPMTACGHRVRFVATWREEFFEVPIYLAIYRLTWDKLIICRIWYSEERLRWQFERESSPLIMGGSRGRATIRWAFDAIEEPKTKSAHNAAPTGT